VGVAQPAPAGPVAQGWGAEAERGPEVVASVRAPEQVAGVSAPDQEVAEREDLEDLAVVGVAVRALIPAVCGALAGESAAAAAEPVPVGAALAPEALAAQAQAVLGTVVEGPGAAERELVSAAVRVPVVAEQAAGVVQAAAREQEVVRS
jgi:hypothetical protein